MDESILNQRQGEAMEKQNRPPHGSRAKADAEFTKTT
jgi:hypothetical protein